MVSKFKVGDKVLCIHLDDWIKDGRWGREGFMEGGIYTVAKISAELTEIGLAEFPNHGTWKTNRFEYFVPIKGYHGTCDCMEQGTICDHPQNWPEYRPSPAEAGTADINDPRRAIVANYGENFKAGHKLRCVKPRRNLTQNRVYEVISTYKNEDGRYFVKLLGDGKYTETFYADRFVLATEEKPAAPQSTQKIDYLSITKEIVGR
jgi:hypothetical protein